MIETFSVTVTPPVRSVTRALHDTPNDKSSDGTARIECCRSEVVVLDPPVMTVFTQPEHKDKAGSAPHGEVERDGRRHHTSGVENERNMNILPETVGVLLGQEPERNR